MAAAWIVYWNLVRKVSPKLDTRPHILPRRWRSSRVFDYVRCLYWNSPLWFPFESLERINMSQPSGFHQGSQDDLMRYGDVPHLIGCYAKDFQISPTTAGEFVMEWTMPPRCHYDSKTRSVVWDTQPGKQRFVYDGRASDFIDTTSLVTPRVART